ncbi:hypothetical protein SERLADRAFT_476390 [Serpula lacrymans var. lacrymans S7.9]|uniref:Uncharacterized protein n=1 Tax=Serpula lacrymans var. lacrymans (strain S7.9) TaxID=578457 RepID=F8P7C6_SERL9|nr:uncharacterized protein SERLADRAFT_476390 [Serpula lacrymans var. lacrymans S7.9]EGO21342.1 hypothetical protein SERLADRAFT_476390 [Serpula lacrymans var. lacrymans S7.9]
MDIVNQISRLSLADDEAGWPDPGDGVVERCLGGSAWSVYNETPGAFYPYAAETSFEFPVDYEILYLLARGGANIGTITIVNSNVVKNTADVLVHVGYHTQQALDHANVCLLNKGPGYHNTQGVGIYTPIGWFPSEQEGRMHFDVTVTLPATPGGKPLQIKRFDITTSHYSVQIQDIQNSVYFDDITVRADAAGIMSKSISARSGTFMSTKAYVRGAFNVTDVWFSTTSGPIDVQVGHRDVGSYLTRVPLGTNENSMQSTFSEYATSGGSFSVDAKTINGPITVSYTNAPVDSVQTFNAATEGAPVAITMSSTYEGNFRLETSGDNPIVVRESDAKDPSGRGRERVLVKNPQDASLMYGTVYWDPQGPGWEGSYITIRTNRSPIWLTV